MSPRALKLATFCLILVSCLLVAFNLIRMDAVQRFLSIEYRVFGRVQGVFFRKYTKEKADQLGIFGWVQNERDGTVSGLLQGAEPKIEDMKNWLSHKGSPLSRIDKCEFSNEKVLDRLDLTSFIIKRG